MVKVLLMELVGVCVGVRLLVAKLRILSFEMPLILQKSAKQIYVV